MEDALCDDMIVAIMKHLDPLSAVLFGMTSKCNQERRKRQGVVKIWSALPRSVFDSIEFDYFCDKPLRYSAKQIKISVMCECFATPHVYDWADSVWRVRKELAVAQRLRQCCVVVSTGNFELGVHLGILPPDEKTTISEFNRALVESNIPLLNYYASCRDIQVSLFHYKRKSPDNAVWKWLKAHDPMGDTMPDFWFTDQLDSVKFDTLQRSFRERYFISDPPSLT